MREASLWMSSDAELQSDKTSEELTRLKTMKAASVLRKHSTLLLAASPQRLSMRECPRLLQNHTLVVVPL